jgi:tetratricopeptide (TPR) repeat protein
MNRKSNIRIFIVFILVLIVVPVTTPQDKFQRTIPNNLVLRFNRAKTLRDQSKLPNAIQELNTINSINSGYYQSWYNLGLAYNSQKDYAKAEDSYKKALAIRDKENIPDAMIFNSMGVMYIQKGDYNSAEKYLKQAEQHIGWLSIDQKQKLYNNLGVLYLYKGNNAESEKYFNTASKQLNYTPAQENLKRLNIIKQPVK